MPEVTLIIKASNEQYIAKMKEAQNASQRLHETSVAGGKREKGILEEIDSTLARLEKSKRKAFTIEDIERYNKKIAEAKQHLDEYENAGKQVTKETESMIQSIGKWVLGLGLAAKALDMLKTALKDTVGGMLAFNVAGAAMKQVLYNIVTGVSDWNQGVAQAIILAKQMNDLRLKDRIEMIKAKELMREYNQLYTKSIENMDDSVTKIANLTKAKQKYQQAIQIEIDSTKEQLEQAKKALALRPLSESAQNEVVKLYSELQDLLGEQEAGIRRISRQIATEQKALFTDVLDAVKKFNLELDQQLQDIYDEEKEKAQKEADEILAIQTKFYENDAKTRKFWADKKAEEAENEITPMDILKEKTENAQQDIGDLLDEAARREEQRKEADAKATDDLENKKTRGKEIALAESVRLAQMTADLVTTISNNQMNRELLALDQKTKMLLEIASLNGLTKEEEVFIYEQAEKKKLEIEKKYRLQRQKIAIAQAVIDGAAAVAKTFAEYGGLPIAWIIAALVTAQIAAQIAIIKAQKFAKGGWTGDRRGNNIDETGEEIAGTVHKEEFVTKRGPASKYREVLEAINRDDKKAIYNSFTKIEPELIGNTTNVTVENSGPNNRLDRINNQLSQLNRNLSPKRQVREDVMTDGNTTIIRRGANVRTIRR